MTDYEKLKNIIDEANTLIEKSITASSPEFKAWISKMERFVLNKYGEDSYEFKSIDRQSYSLSIFTTNTPDSAWVDACIRGIKSAKAILETYLEEMQEESKPEVMNIISNLDFEKVFIVHGHDGELKEAVARLIEKQDLEAIILSEQANKGKTIIEKFEENSDVSGAICLFTSDDLGRAKSNLNEQLRARQNVVFEAGYFMGKLGRDKVVIIAESGVEMPSDMQGIVYTDKNNWQFDVLKELKAIGYDIDFNKLI